jgi:uncharacterized protein
MGVQAIKNEDLMREIITSCQICHLGMCDNNGKPYVLPFNFGMDDEYIWLHSALKGRKTDIINDNPSVCLAFSNDFELGHRHDNVACSYFMKYKSVLIEGDVEIVEDYDEKVKGMNIIMKQYTGKDDFSYNSPSINNVLIFRVSLKNMSGRSYT